MDFTQFSTRTCSESSSSDNLHTDLVPMKFYSGTIDIISLSGSLSIAWFSVSSLAESNSQLSHVLTGQCLKFRHDTFSFAMLSSK